MADDEYDLVYAKLEQIVEDIGQHRLAGDLEQRLGCIVCVGTKAGPLTSQRNDGFHRQSHGCGERGSSAPHYNLKCAAR